MPYLRPSSLLLLILSVLLSLLILSCDPDEAKKKPSENNTTQDDQDNQDQDDNNDNQTNKTSKPTISKIPIASLGTISTTASKDASNTGWVFQGEKITFTTTAKDKDDKEISAARFSWAWRKRGKETKSKFGRTWTPLSFTTKTVTIPIKADERVGAYELRVSAESGGQKRDNNEKLYEFTVRKKEGCPAPNTKNAPADLAALKAMVTGSSPSVTGEDLNAIDTSQVESLYELFKDDRNFDDKINCWDVSDVTNMSQTFKSAIIFNQNIGDWDVSKVTNMYGMFSLTSFNNGGNASIGQWDTSKVTTMNAMFDRAYFFNQDIGNWDVSNVTNMQNIFSLAKKFNHDLSRWEAKQIVRPTDCFGFDGGTSWEEKYKPKFKVSC